MDHSDKVLEILESVKGRPQTLNERKCLAVELAGLILQNAEKTMSSEEKKVQIELSKLMEDPIGKAFTTALTDECFRSSSNLRIADQMIFLINQMGIPKYLDCIKRFQLRVFCFLGPKIAQYLVPLATQVLRKQTETVILPGEKDLLEKHLTKRKKQEVRLNLNHLGEAILSEHEAQKRLHIYLEDLKNPEIDYVSIKISTIFSQINLLAFDSTVDLIAERLRFLYRAAMKTKEHKFVNLDMEEYRDLDLTAAVFQKVLNEPEFFSFSAGIVLQAYLPDAFCSQKTLTKWAIKRVQNGGAPIKIRIVKGANLAMEQFEASLKGWPQTPYPTKVEVDANYKRMLLYGCIPENTRAVRLGIASHNLFDITFAMLLRLENQVEAYTSFEMLEGMADHIRRFTQTLTADMLLYCPVATREDFQHAIAYLIRRLDENTGAENFLRHIFGLKPGTEAWNLQTSIFLESCALIEKVSESPHRQQNRQLQPQIHEPKESFENEPDTDFTLKQNRKWADNLSIHWKNVKLDPIPIQINGKELFDNEDGIGFSPNEEVDKTQIRTTLYTYTKATNLHIEKAIKCAKGQEKKWKKTTIQHRSQLLAKAAQKLRERRGELIGTMLIDGAKTISEADPEVSEAIDFAEYYRRQVQKMHLMTDIEWTPKGTVLVVSPWNFPCAIPVGGISAALATGNCVLFKPASNTVLVGWHLINVFWDAGVPKEVLQFIPCSGEELGNELIQDSRINTVILTGGTATAKKILKLRPDLDLAAETGGKNSMILTALCDRDLAIKELIFSAFSNVGQKCSAASLAILESEIYDDPHFMRSLKEAVKSLKVGASWDLTTKINPLIAPPKKELKRALTTLEKGEQWLLEPKQDPHNPCLWSPGIKKDVTLGSFTHVTELFGPVLGLMRAKNLDHAIDIANQVPYGLTSGLQSLDQREHNYWIDRIEAGNLYINRSITGAVVRRQPFGGYKNSSVGNGAKAGGPNYLRQFMKASQLKLPQDKYPVNNAVNLLTNFLDKIELSAEELGLWTASCANYAFWSKRLKQDCDPSKVVGQDNYLRYVPRKKMIFRLLPDSNPLDALRVCAAVLSCQAEMQISWMPQDSHRWEFNWLDLVPQMKVIEESDQKFLERIDSSPPEKIRFIDPAPLPVLKIAAKHLFHVIDDPVLANGRFELLHYLREVTISIDYHRYGNLGLREGEMRKPTL